MSTCNVCSLENHVTFNIVYTVGCISFLVVCVMSRMSLLRPGVIKQHKPNPTLLNIIGWVAKAIQLANKEIEPESNALFCVYPIGGDKVSIYAHTYQHKPPRKIKWLFAVTSLTALCMWLDVGPSCLQG